MNNSREESVMFGAAYYPEYMPYERMEKDFQMMLDAGMNTIRIAESTWSTWEPEDGVFDFSILDRTLEMAEQKSIHVILGTPTYAVPAWLVRKDPSVMVTTADGQQKYGHRQLIDITNPVFLFHAERIIREMLKRFANCPCVTGFQIDNETKHYGTSSKRVQMGFLDYLKRKFKTIGALNKAFGLAYWSNSIADWEDFPDINGCVNGGLAAEFSSYQRSLVNEYLAWQAAIVGEYRQDNQFITHNFDFQWKKFGADIAQDGYSYGVQPDVNHYQASKCLTICGTDIYHPGQDNLTGAETAFCGDSIRSLKHSNYLVLETQAQAFKYWTPYPGQLKLQAYSHLASGADGILYWNWHSIHNGYETYWKGILSHDLESNPVYEEASQIGTELKNVGSELIHLKKENHVALVVDNRSLTALEWFPIDKDLSYNDVVRWMYDALYELNIECDVIDVNDLTSSIEEYQMLVVPALYSVEEKIVGVLDQFVKKGGTIISSFRSFVANEHLSVYPDRQPHGLLDCFGISYNQFTEPGTIKVAGKPVQYFAELLKPESDKTDVLHYYQHKYWKKYAAVTRNEYGSGQAYYIGCYLDKSILKQIFQAAVSKMREFDASQYAWPVIIRSVINTDNSVIHYLFHYSQDDRIIRCPFNKVRDILSHTIYNRNDEIILHDWDVKILKEIE